MNKEKCRVLCVDDHHDTSEMMKVLLGQEDYEVSTATTFDQAIKLAESEHFDLFVLDKRLPDGNGLELCQKLSQLKPHAACIFYSGDAYDIHRVQAMEAGADAYVAKPDIEGLIKAVHDCLANTECATTS